MERYGWDIDFINKRQEYYQHLIEETKDKAMLKKYEDLYELYSLLILDKLFSDGEVVSSNVPVNERLKEIKEIVEPNKYTDEVLSIKDSITNKMRSLEMGFPYVQFSKSMNDRNLIDLIGEAIHDIFGDDAYKDYKSIAIDSNTKIQIGNSESSACVYNLNDGEYSDYYIILPRKRNIMIVNSLVHEAGHHHRFVVNGADILENHILREYESFSYEIRVLDYFIKNGIYKREAVKAMIRIINMLDAFAEIFNDLDLLDSKNAREMTRKAHERNIYNRLHIPNNEILLEYLYSIKSDYMFPYIYSAMCVFDHLKTDDNLEKYNTVIHEIGKTPEMDLVKKIVDDPSSINNLNGYSEYRKEIKKIYRGE